MNAAQLLAHFDRLVTAPDAIPRLRWFVLDLAVRGKLVPQVPTDEPAAVLKQRITADRNRLMKEKELSRDSVVAHVVSEDEPFSRPSNWEWVRLGSCMRMVNGRAFKPTDWQPAGLPIVRIQNLNNETAPFNYCNPRNIDERHLINDGAFLISWSGTPGTSFGAFIWRRGKAALNQHIFKCFQIGAAFDDRFLRLAINGRLDELIAKAHGGVGLQHITKGKLENLVLSLPPLAEQLRIIEKVDELMALCDRLEAAQTEREGWRDRLVRASLARLNQPDDDAAAFRDHARFALGHLPRLTTRPEHIAQLRQTILNLAVRGKLVPQDPTDEPAPSFGVNGESDNENRIVLCLPQGWSWTRVEDVSDSRLGKMLDKAKNTGKPYPYLRNTNVHWFDIRLDELKTLRLEDTELETFLLRKGDVLICEGGHGIGRTAVWRAEADKVVFQKALHRVRPKPMLLGDFFAQCVFVYFHTGILQRYYTGVGIPHFTGVALSKLVFPLPPLPEQHRIVAKVDELMAVCGRLEAHLTTAQADRGRLLEAVLHKAP